MITFEDVRGMILSLPDTVEGMSWDARSFKVNGKVILFWNTKYDCPVFKVGVDERDLLLELDPETFFVPDHHRNHSLILARPERVDPGWARANIERVWRAQARKATLKAYDAAHG